MIKKTALLLALALLLGGCAGAVPVNPSVSRTLPPPETRYEPPVGHAAQDYAETVQLSVPELNGGQLIMTTERILIPPDKHPAQATLTKLFSFTGNDKAAPLFPDTQLALQGSGTVEISGDVATVDMGANAALLSRQDFLTLCRAVTNTLCQWGDIRYVNVLVSGRAPSMDVRGLVPLGSLQQVRNEEAPALFDSYAARGAADALQSQRYSSLCTLYYPAPSGRGILAEARAVSFPGQDIAQMAMSLLEALSARAQTLPQAPQVPDLQALLAAPPQLSTFEDGRRILSLEFLPIANETFIQAGVPRSVMLSALSYTLCTYLPGVEGITVRIGNEQIEAIVPSGIYEGAGEQISFSDGVLRRGDFASFLLADCTLYLGAPGGGLRRVRRPVPHELSHSKPYLLSQLIAGPQIYDSVPGSLGITPRGVTADDILGTGISGGTALVNLSEHLQQAAQGMNPQQERALVYSIVNTLCESRGIRRVQLFVEGLQPQTLAGSVYLPGEFLFNPDISQE